MTVFAGMQADRLALRTHASAPPLPHPPQRYNATVTAINATARTVTLAGGEVLRYGKLLNTLPLDTTLAWLGRRDLAAGLVHSSSHIVGIGIRGSWCAPRCATSRMAPCRAGARPEVVPMSTPHTHDRTAPRATRPARTPQPPRLQVLAVLPRGGLPLLPRDRVQQLRRRQLPAAGRAPAHAVRWRWEQQRWRRQRGGAVLEPDV